MLTRYVEADWTLFSVTDRGKLLNELERQYEIVLDGSSIDFVQTIALNLTQDGLRSIWIGCGSTEPQFMLQPGYTTKFLLPPPEG